MTDNKSEFLTTDRATDTDSLGFQPYVEAIAEFLTAKGTEPPITLSIEGEWGCGKSSFMKQLQAGIEKLNKDPVEKMEDEKTEDKSQIDNKNQYKIKIRLLTSLFLNRKRKKYFTIWFNCWRYEKEDELWAAFALCLMEQLSEQLSWAQRLLAQLKLRYLRLEFKWKSKNSISLHILFFIFAVCILSYSIANLVKTLYFNPITGLSSNILVTLTGIVGPLLPIFYFWKDIKDIVGNPFDFNKFVSNPNYTEHISFIEYFHSDFSKIIKSYAGNSRVYVFIDDLDRCEIPKAAELMQALNLMISDEANIYFSIGMDRKVISAGLAAKNEQIIKYMKMDGPEHGYGLEYGYDFIEKFIQLPFKVPSPKNKDFRIFMNPHNEEKGSSKASWLSDNSLINSLKNLFRRFKSLYSSSQSNEKNIHLESTEDVGLEKDTQRDDVTEKSEKEEQIINDDDCDRSDELNDILEIVSPALGNNPRRIKQFINQFRFQRTIGKRTGLFSYKERIDPEKMWNCKKLAKFVAISIKWPSLISDMSKNMTLLEQLQEYALKLKIEHKKSEGDNEKIEEENKDLERWTKDEKLIRLLKYGCIEGGNKAEYTLSGLDFSKLLKISPKVDVDEMRNLKFVLIPKGEFMMGSREDEISRSANEGPVHKVVFKEAFMIGKYQVTQRQWVEVMGNNPSRFKGDNLPVENVSWDDVQRFVNNLNMIEGIDKYSLPSEAEWEYVCRAGVTTKYCSGNEESELRDYSWYGGNSGGETHPVGMKNPNHWGVYDMHGNVWEWVQDNWHDNYNGAPSDGSAWEEKNISDRVLRGGGWSYNADSCRSAIRRRSYPGSRGDALGFRLVKKL